MNFYHSSVCPSTHGALVPQKHHWVHTLPVESIPAPWNVCPASTELPRHHRCLVFLAKGGDLHTPDSHKRCWATTCTEWAFCQPSIRSSVGWHIGCTGTPELEKQNRLQPDVFSDQATSLPFCHSTKGTTQWRTISSLCTPAHVPLLAVLCLQRQGEKCAPR